VRVAVTTVARHRGETAFRCEVVSCCFLSFNYSVYAHGPRSVDPGLLAERYFAHERCRGIHWPAP